MPSTNIFSTRPLIGEDDDRKKTQQTNAEAAAAAATTPAVTPTANADKPDDDYPIFTYGGNNNKERFIMYRGANGEMETYKIPEGYKTYDDEKGRISVWDEKGNKQVVYGANGPLWQRTPTSSPVPTAGKTPKQTAAAHAIGQDRGYTSEVLADGTIVYKDKDGIEMERHYVDEDGDVERVVYRDGTVWRRGQDDGKNGAVGDTGDDYSDMIDEGDKFDVNDEGDEEGKKKAKRNHFVPDNTPTAEDVNMRNTDLVEMPQGSKEGVPTQPGKFGGVVEPDEDKWDRMMREEKEKYEAGKAQLMELLKETESEEDKKKRERRERAGRIASGIGDMTSALANLVFTAKGGPNAYTGKDTLSEASRERYERLKKEREADEAYNAKVRTALENWEKDYRALLQKMEAAKDTRDAKAADLAEKKRHNTKMEEEAANRNRIAEEENKRKAQAQANKPVKQSKPRTSTSSSQSGGKKKKSGRKPEGWK